MHDGFNLISSSEKIIFSAFLVFAVLIFLRVFYIRLRLLGMGRKDDGFSVLDMFERLRYFLIYVPGQWCNIKNIRQKDLAGLAHLFIFWGATLFAVNYFLFFLLSDGLGLPYIRETRFASIFLWVTEPIGILLIAALISGVVRRGFFKPARLGPDFEFQTFLAITVSAVLLLSCYYILEGSRLHLVSDHVAGPISYATAGLMSAAGLSIDAQLNLFQAAWWIHNLILIGLIVYIPFSKHQHALFFPVSLLKKSPSEGLIKPLSFDKGTGEGPYGVQKVQDLPWNQLVELYACAQCGRCQEVCPASLSGKPLSPKKIIQDLRKALDAKGNFDLNIFSKLFHKQSDDLLVDKYIGTEEIWDCTTCMACVKNCPALIEQLDKIIEIRRNLTLSESRFPSEYKQIFKNMEIFGDTMGKGKLFREDWTAGLQIKRVYEEDPVDYIFWTGCMGPLYDEKTRAALRSTAGVLDKSGLNWGILGKEELCCGDWARRVGNEYLYEQFVRRNIEVFEKYRIRRLVTNCPHCYNTLKREYAQFGAKVEVLHLVELIERMAKRGKLKIKSRLDQNLTYHDPCYLGRYNSIYAAPRKVLGMALTPMLKEMPQLNDKSFCCGAGGGNFWRGGGAGQRMEEIRIEEAMETGADGIVTACPYCKIMFNSAVKEKGREHSFSVLEISEIINQVID